MGVEPYLTCRFTYLTRCTFWVNGLFHLLNLKFMNNQKIPTLTCHGSEGICCLIVSNRSDFRKNMSFHCAKSTPKSPREGTAREEIIGTSKSKRPAKQTCHWVCPSSCASVAYHSPEQCRRLHNVGGGHTTKHVNMTKNNFIWTNGEWAAGWTAVRFEGTSDW